MPYNKTLEEGLKEIENTLPQAILGALEYRGFYDCGKYLDDDILEHIKPHLTTFAEKIRGGVVEETIEKMKMEGIEHKLTPFQSTVNTYIKNRGEELLTQLKK